MFFFLYRIYEKTILSLQKHFIECFQDNIDNRHYFSDRTDISPTATRPPLDRTDISPTTTSPSLERTDMVENMMKMKIWSNFIMNI